MELNQQYRLLQQQAGVSGFYNTQVPPLPRQPMGSPGPIPMVGSPGMRQPMMDAAAAQYGFRAGDFSEDESYDGPLGPRSMPRRSKRTIPDGEKDARYWEKRKRNNEAAKRSRENKRKLDFEIRNRLGFLEEENALMRRELEILKTKLCIPVDQSVLSAEERAEVLTAVEKSVNLKGSPGSDDIEIIPGPGHLMMSGTMDLSKRSTPGIPMPVQIKRDPDELPYMMSHPLNAPLMWQEQPPMTSYSPPDVIKRTGQFVADKQYQVLQTNPFLRNQRNPYDIYQMQQHQQYQQPPSPQLERLPQSPPSISPVVDNLNSSMNASTDNNQNQNLATLNHIQNELQEERNHEELRMKIGELSRVGKVKDGRWEDHIPE